MRITLVQVERGELAEAYAAASRLVARRPRAARAYFVRSYVLRYGGDLDRAVRDCDTALALDPNNPFFRSCGITNSLAGRYERALQFLELDAGSQFSLDNNAMVRMRQGRPREAAVALRQSSLQNVAAVIAYLEEGKPLPPAAVRQIVDATLELSDSEQQYWNGSILTYCGEHAAGLRLIREGIARGFCSYPFMESDPLLAGLRGDALLAAEYAAARAAGRACHGRFLADQDSG